MKNINLLLLILAIAIAFAGCGTKNKNIPKRHIPTEKELAAFELKIKSLANALNISKLSYAIVNEKGIIQTRGIGADENTVYPVGTLSNIFTSTIALQLLEEKKLDLKKHVGEYSTSPNYKSATVKQLLSFTASGEPGKIFKYEPASFDLLEDIFQTVTETNYSSLFKKKIARSIGLKNTSAAENQKTTTACTSTIYDLAKFSQAVDNHNLFNEESTQEMLFRPVFLSNGEITPSALGWLVQFYNDKKYVWSFGQGKDFSSLIIKSLTDSISLIVLANNENFNKPFNLDKCDLFASPIATEFVKNFVLYKDTLPKIDLNSRGDSIKTSLLKCNSLKQRDLLVKEYLSYIRLYNYIGDSLKSKQLAGIFNQALPVEIPYELLSKEPRAVIKDASDYINISRLFELENDTEITVFSVGEYVKELTSNIWEYDLVELYFDYDNNKKKTFDNSAHRQYRFNYDYSDVTGTFTTNENIKFVQSEPTKNSYIFEISIPFKTLGNAKPEIGKKIGFDMNATDNDGGTQTRENFITWHFQKREEAWADASVFGTMILSTKSEAPNDSICYSLKINSPVKIDGKIDNDWNTAKKYRLNRTTYDKFPKENDFSVVYRTLWDNDNIYFLVEVTDENKYKIPEGGDWGWIENEKNDTVWMMNLAGTNHAGGAQTNRFVHTRIPLKKGKYMLRYKTNQTESYNRWTIKRPEVSFYGIAVY